MRPPISVRPPLSVILGFYGSVFAAAFMGAALALVLLGSGCGVEGGDELPDAGIGAYRVKGPALADVDGGADAGGDR